MHRWVLTLLIIVLAGVAQSQEPSTSSPPKPPACIDYELKKTQAENPSGLSPKQRLCIYRDRLFSGQALFGSAFFSGVAQFRDDPTEWGQGSAGYFRRFGTRYTQGAAKTTGEYLFATILHEDPRLDLSQKAGFWNRTWYALENSVTVKNLAGKRRPAFSRYVGAASSGAVGLAWYPGRLNTPGQVFGRIGTAYGGYVASSIFNEFQVDIFHGIGLMLGSDRANNKKQTQPTTP